MGEPAPILIDVPEEVLGPRVLLRPYRLEDAAPIWEAVAASRAHIAAWLPWADAYRSVDDARAFVARARARWILREDLAFGIFEREGGRLLGGTGLHRVNWPRRAFEIGYWVRADATGRGYAREAVAALTRLAFERLDAGRVEIRMDPRNLRSKNVPRRLGFVHEGTLRRIAGPPEAPTDRDIFALLPEDYRALPWARGEPP